MPQPLTGLSVVVDRYDVFILDLWGVVHNGKAPYPGAPECMRRLRAAGKTVLLLSNAPRRSAAVVQFLTERIGLGAGHYDDVVTSGDLTRDALSDDARRWRSYYRLGPERDWGLLDGLPFAQTERIGEADFVLCTGLLDDETEKPEDYDPLFGEAIRRDLVMVCANPDLHVMRGDYMVPCAGALAQRYAELGGKVELHGKPYADAYRACRARVPRGARLLAVGDSLRTDIAGANAAAIDSALAAGGIHADEWGVKPGEMPDMAVLARSLGDGPRPTFVLPALVW